MMRPLRAFGCAAVLSLAACVCSRVPERIFPCDADADCLQAGQRCVGGYCAAPVLDGGVDGGDAGETDAGFDAGFDAGTDAGPAVEFCNTWACVLASVDLARTQTQQFFFLESGVDGGAFGWFGGVLAPNGYVIAIPQTARYVLQIDVKARQVTVLGPHLPWPDDGVRMWGGGVLADDGYVYAAPFDSDRFLRIDPNDGGVALVGPSLPPSQFSSAVLDAYGFIWAAPDSTSRSATIVRFDPRTGTARTWDAADAGLASWGGWGGIVRLPDDRLLAMPKEPTGAAAPLDIDPKDVSFALRAWDGGAARQFPVLGTDGEVLAASSAAPEAYRYGPPDYAVEEALKLPATPGSFASAEGGAFYMTPDLDGVIVAVDADAGSQRLLEDAGTARYAYAGFVATPLGMVGIPCVDTRVLIVVPAERDRRTMPALLSPYFNHH